MKLMTMLGVAGLLLAAGVARAELVTYRDYDVTTRSFTNACAVCRSLTDTDTTLTLESGWYAVHGDIEPNGGVKIRGDVHLVLCDYSSMCVWCGYQNNAAVSVCEGSSLTIYGQRNGNGFLWARCESGVGVGAGIGADNGCRPGAVTIVGGEVLAEGGKGGGAGIGGCAFGAGGTVTVRGGCLRAVGGDAAADDIGAGRTNGEKDKGTVRISGGNLWKQPEEGWVDPRATVVPNVDSQTRGDYPWSVIPLWKVTIGEHSKVSAKWTSGDGSVTNEITGTYFEVPDGNKNVKVLFAPAADRQIYGDTEVRLGSVTRDIVFGVGNNYATPFAAVAYVVTPIVTTNYYKYGEDVLRVTGAVTNDHPSVAAAIDAARIGDSVVLDMDVSESLSIAGERMVAIDLNGHTLSPSAGDDAVVRFAGTSSNAVLSIAGGTLSGDLRLGTSGGVSTNAGCVMLSVVSDGDIFAAGEVQVVLPRGFRSTYTNGVYSTEVPLLAQQGAAFGFRHNPMDPSAPGKLAFPDPDLQLNEKDGEFVVGYPPIMNQWSFDLTDWMADIPDDTPISKICLPATHDSGMSEGTLSDYGVGTFLSDASFQTQRYTTEGQLNIGCRYFDFRFLSEYDGSILTFHAPSAGSVDGKSGESLKDILSAISTFLENHPTEFVLVGLSHWGKVNRGSIWTQKRTLGEFQSPAFSRYLFRSTSDMDPILNSVPISQVRGRVIVMVDPAEGTNPISPKDGVWGFCKKAPKPGCYCMYDNYANSDEFEEMKADQLEKWQMHANDPEREAFSLDWTLTAQYPVKYKALLAFMITLTAATFVAVVAIIMVAIAPTGFGQIASAGMIAFLGGTLAAAITGAIEFKLGYEPSHMNVEKMADEANSQLESTLNACMASENPRYAKPSFVSIDFASPELTRAIIRLNSTDLLKFAAEVVRDDGMYCMRYGKLNDAFTNANLRVSDNGCTVRLLRNEEPENDEVFTVPADAHVRFDLNGKWLRPNAQNGNRALMVNNGELEIVNSDAESGGFDETLFENYISRNINLERDGECWRTASSIIYNSGNARLKVKDVKANLTGGEFKVGGQFAYDRLRVSPAGAFVRNNGGEVELDGVTVRSKYRHGLYQDYGTAILRNSTIHLDGSGWALNGNTMFMGLASPCVGMGENSLIEMYGGHISANVSSSLRFDCDQTGPWPAPEYVALSGKCRFVMHSGEIRGSSPDGPDGRIYVNGPNAKVIVYDGFVKGGGSSPTCFKSNDPRQITVYGGCYGVAVNSASIANGVCEETSRFAAYPWEVVPTQGGEKAVARIVGDRSYPSLQAAMDAAKDRPGNTTIELLCNVHPVETLVFPASASATLDLMGHAIVKRGVSEPVICNKGGLTLTDSALDGQAEITAFDIEGQANVPSKGGIVFNEGTLVVARGVLKAGSAEKGAGIYNETNANCLVSGGVITGCAAKEAGGGIFNRGVLTLRGGLIENCSAASTGGGVRNEGDLTIVSGEIRDCTAAVGGGLDNGNEAVLFGGEIAGNGATGGVGAGIYSDTRSRTTICGAWVKDPIGTSGSLTAKVLISEGFFGTVPNAAWIMPGSVSKRCAVTGYPIAVGPEAVARIGGRRFYTLAGALNAAVGPNEVTVSLLAHVRNVDTTVPEGCHATLDLAGHWILGGETALDVSAGASLRIVDSAVGGTVNAFFATNGAPECAIRNSGTCRIEGGRYGAPVRVTDSAQATTVVEGLFAFQPEAAWIASSSCLSPNEDDETSATYPVAVRNRKTVAFKDEPDALLPLQQALSSERLCGDALQSVLLREDTTEVCVTVPAGRRAVLDLRGRRLQGVAYRPAITVEKGAALTIVDSVGGGMIVKGAVEPHDADLQGGILNYGFLTLAGGMISNCVGVTYGGVRNAEGATFMMTGGAIVGCGATAAGGTADSAGVFNAGTFWMTGGEIAGCESDFTLGVFNAEGAVFRQLGGVIRDGRGDASANYVGNRGQYVLVDGRIDDGNVLHTNEIRCIANYILHPSTFTLMWGEVLAKDGGTAIGNISGAGCAVSDQASVRISNGKVRGKVSSSVSGDFGVVGGGFFTGEQASVLNSVSLADFADWELNADLATNEHYPYCVTPQYEAEVVADGVVEERTSLQNALNMTGHGSYVVRLATDVKDCVVCSNTVPVTLDLNGYAITGTGKVFGDGFARSVIRNEGILMVVDSSERKTGFIAMPSVGESEKGGAICNLGTLDLDDIAIWCCRARLGGGVYNAPGATARLTNVRMAGCRASGAEAGDLVLNAGTLALEGCTLEAWVDATNASHVREGGALVNAGTATLEDCRVRGRIVSPDGASPVGITSGLFDHEPPTVYRANTDEETRLVYRWEVVGGQTIVATLPGEVAGVRVFETLADALAAAKYGSTITIVGDVSGENVKVPIGMTVVVEQAGTFREPEAGDLRHAYYRVTTRVSDGKTYYTYGLNEEMVVPRIGASDGTPAMEFVRDDAGKVTGVRLNVVNVYEDLYYVVYWGLSPLPGDMVPVTWECADHDGAIRLQAPADGESGFYQIRVTDHLE